MVGWLIIAVAIFTVTVVLRWGLKGGGIGGYSATDQSAIKRTRTHTRLRQRLDERQRRAGRARTWL